MFKKIKQELKYGFKALRLFWVRYVGLQIKYGDVWENASNITSQGSCYENPDYVCARFTDGHRLPLPLLENPQKSKYVLQKVVLLALLRVGKLGKAREDCLAYVEDWKAEEAFDDLRLRTIEEEGSPELQPPVRVWNERLQSWATLRKGTYLIHVIREA